MLSIKNYPGRFCNHVFRNLAFSYVAKNNNLQIEYYNPEEIQKLGFELFFYNQPKNEINKIIIISDENFMDYITGSPCLDSFFIIKTRDTYCQTKDFVLFLYNQYYENDENKKKIINANIFKSRYNNNSDVFVHVRLGDAYKDNPGFYYYDSVLSKLSYKNGYISSDAVYNPIVQNLITKYNLILILFDEVKTIQFASTCKYTVLSNGTFSWMIGFLGFFSEIYFPKIKNQWHGDIFVIPHWKEIDW
jgi:hypothetical protein